MTQWLNRSHPQTLQAGVILGYIGAVFGLLFPQDLRFLPSVLGWIIGPLVFLGLGIGAFFTANNKRWGYAVLAVCATIAALIRIRPLIDNILTDRLEVTLESLNLCVFPVALAAAVLHVQSRQYQKAWFE